MHSRPCSADLRPGTSRARTVTAALLVGLTAGCSGAGAEVAGNATPSPLPCDSQATAAAPPDIVVLSTGDSPRSTLRYRPTPGLTAPGTVRESITDVRTLAGTTTRTTTTTRLPFTLRITAVCGAVFTTRTSYGTPTVSSSGDRADAARRRMSLLDGLTVREVRNNRGAVIRSSRSAPGGVDPASQQTVDDLLRQLDQSALVFPSTALGVGARWTSTRRQQVAGFSLTLTTTYTISQRSARQVALAARLAVTAPAQAIRQQGRRLTLDSYQATGSGSLRVDLTSGVVTAGTLTESVHGRIGSDDQITDDRATQTIRLSGR